ncbi:PQQ-dependent sugar dehydrogenase [Nocardioides aequoreus]|uniref:PQQ-dependent sugar dehydrogenase n=1 Tax=Nocardioides aequoreus TaxID=397278 RepID=UPI0004C43651|nr:PQQ-dependent sugar dehydrogenase [Nocardioides aequoreus]
MRRLLALLAALVSGLLTATLVAAPPTGAAVPDLRVTTLVGGLDQPWDVKPLPDGSLLVTERASKRLLHVAAGGGRVTSVAYDRAAVWSAGETGLMSLEVDPDFASNRRFYTCQGGYGASRRDVRVVARRLSADGTAVTAERVVLAGLPATTGRHGGCRLLIARSGHLVIGTGDAAVGRNPRDLRSGGGKVLRVDRVTGRPVRGNPFLRSGNGWTKRVLSYGHRNVQGLAQSRDGTLWSVEHGSSRDDEVNRIVAGGDYGWHPVPGYDESVPMTDKGLPGVQQAARWRSGNRTIATSGAAWVTGSRWGDLDGTLAVAALKGERVAFMKPTGTTKRIGTIRRPAELLGIGRLRSITQLPGGDLLVTTADGGGRDRVLRVSPR